MQGAFETGVYPNRFAAFGHDDDAVRRKLEETFQTMFYGPEDRRIYHPVGDDMGYMEDTGNHDARTEGMSYGMMFCVQMDRKEEFDRLWRWVMTYMYMGQRRERRVLCLVLPAGRDQEFLGPCAGRRGVLCDGAVLCRQPLGQRRGHL